ncbi:proteasome subunit alpha type-1-like [Paramacrobiotus metropolitanus]|uniref:proteasome subunit alpha type-1-like n=1 Tax=Paramacrobiotus metropolitanus TaxID=2943436 RepID=UPI002445E6E2|nr:proteasome subunit alpha type-1-like [Paramacrobiotus metropolitanus]
MFRNQYDYDVTIWSPQGRLHQIEYAMEAVKQGSAVVGMKNSSHAVVAAIKRMPSELASYQKKLFGIDDHCGVGIAGLTADARTINTFLQTECLNHRYAYSKPMPLSRLVGTLGNKMQVSTQEESGRPYGVGLLLIGYDHKGPHLIQIDPSANYYECKGMSIGARSQSARTYLERHVEAYLGSQSVEDLVRHALRALRDTLANDQELSNKLVSVAVVGKDHPFRVYDDESVQKLVDEIIKEPRNPARPAQSGFALDTGVENMDEDVSRPPPPDPEATVALGVAEHRPENP